MNLMPPVGLMVPPQLQLYKGWNLIGHVATIPLSIDDGGYSDFSSIAGLDTPAGGHKFAQILGWTGDDWITYPMGTLREMHPGQGYWILMEEDGFLFGTV